MDVKFSEPAYARTSPPAARSGFISRLVIRTGFTKDEKGAQKILLVVFVVAILATLLIFAFSGSEVRQPSPEVFEGMQ